MIYEFCTLKNMAQNIFDGNWQCNPSVNFTRQIDYPHRSFLQHLPWAALKTDQDSYFARQTN